jgi:hypothetical protein
VASGIVHVGMVTPLAGSRKKSRHAWALLPVPQCRVRARAGGAVDRPALATGANPTEFLAETVCSQRPCCGRCLSLPWVHKAVARAIRHGPPAPRRSGLRSDGRVNDPDLTVLAAGVLLGAALALRAPRLGHVCVELDRVADRVTIEPRSSATRDTDQPDLNPVDLPWPDPGGWQGAFDTSPLVRGAGT